MRLPTLAEGLESAPAVRRAELHREDVAQFAVEVTAFRLGPLHDAHHHVAERGEAFGHDPQGHRLAGSRLARDQGEASFLDQLLDTPGETLDLGGHQQRLVGQLRRKGVPFQPPQGEQFLGVHDAAPFSVPGFLGR